MLKLFFNLLTLSRAENPLMQKLGGVLRGQRGNKSSRFFRHIFGYRKIRGVVGLNLALAFFASSFIPQAPAKYAEDEQSIIQETKTPLTTIKVVQYPLEKMSVSQGFSRYHPGVDLAAPYGEEILPIKPGVVEEAGFSTSGYGNMVIVNHGGGMTSLYAHLSKVSVKQGQEVTPDTVIGKVGASGHTSGSHLHLEIRKDGRAVNPFSVLPLLLASN